MPPERKKGSRKVINVASDDQEDSDLVPDDPSSNAESLDLFVDPLQGNPLVFYVHDDVEDKQNILKLIRIYGGGSSSSYTNASYILVDPKTAAGQNLYILFHNNKKGKTVLDARWVRECVKSKKILAFRANWGGCRVTGQEREEFLKRQESDAAANPIPPLDAAIHVQATTENGDLNAMQVDQPIARGETPSPSRQAEESSQVAPSAGTQGDPNRPAQPLYFPSHPLIYGYPPPSRPGQPMPLPMPWPYIPPGMPLPASFLGPPPQPPSISHPTGDNQQGQVSATYQSCDPSQAQEISQAWMEYYAQMDPYMYARPPDEHNTYQFLSPAAENADSAGRRRGRTRTKNHGSNAKISIKPLAPPARSPSPPTRIVKSTYGGNLFTEEDVAYLKRYIDYCQEQGLLLSLREICERLAVRAPHHTFFSWRRYCNKHQIRLGAYTMEDRDDMGDLEQDGEQDDNPDGGGPSNHIASRTTRNGSPIPPKILYKSTTGKGVAFTQEDVQYMLDYMKYRKEQSSEPLDMVEFWNDLAEKAPHHSRASWMKYWRRHRHELEPNGDQPAIPQAATPVKKSRYTHKDDILLAKHFAQLEGVEREKKTSDAMFQEFASLHPHHPWKGWQEHHRIHKTQIDHLIKQLKEGQELV